MPYESRAYDGEHGEPVVVLVVTGVHDVSRLAMALSQGLCEHVTVAETIRRQVRRHNGGRAALALLKAHGGPDFTGEQVYYPTRWTDPATGTVYDLDREYTDVDGDAWKLSGWLNWTDGKSVPVMTCTDAAEVAVWRDKPLPDVIEECGPLTVRAQSKTAA